MQAEPRTRPEPAWHHLAPCAVALSPGDPPRTASLVLWNPEGGDPPAALGPHRPRTVLGGHGRQPRTVAAAALDAPRALALLARARPDASTHPAAAFWAAATGLALHIAAEGRILPGVSPSGADAWRAGPLTSGHARRITDLAAAMPPQARAVPRTGPGAARPPEALWLLLRFLDTVADVLPRTPEATGLFARASPGRARDLRAWAEELADATDADVEPSLRAEPDGEGGLHLVAQIHSRAEPALLADLAEAATGAAPGFTARSYARACALLRRAAPAWPALQALLEQSVPERLALTGAEAADLIEAEPGLARAGIRVHWSRGRWGELSLAAALRGAAAPAAGEGLALHWRPALDGKDLTAAEIDHLARAQSPIVRLREEWVAVPSALARRLREPAPVSLSATQALGAALTGSIEVGGETVPVHAEEWAARLRDHVTGPARPLDPPEGLHADLRGYQRLALGWLARMTAAGLGCCLADDMGLGKTVTLIALHLHRGNDPATAGPALVVCPASLLGNWEREIGRFAPEAPVRRYHGGDRTLRGADAGFVLTTYATMRTAAEELAAHPWALLVADEAQHVKNPHSQAARRLRAIPAAARVALTGTPIENDLSELWAILDWTTPGLLGGLPAFRRRWAAPVESGRDRGRAEELARLIGPFLLRRRKTDPGIAPELPPRTETDHPVALTEEQVGLYEAAVRQSLAALGESTGMARRGRILRLLTALKQICDHPAHYLRETDPVLTGRSGKLHLLEELLDTVAAEDGAALVFTQYAAMARLLQRHLTARGLETDLLTGSTPVARRDEIVHRFQHGPPGRSPVLVLSLRAAGTGLNLTRADHVVHYDRWWNPAVEDQASDRAHRIGQDKPVQVHRLICEGTLEEHIAAMLRTKHDLARAVLESGPAALSEFSDTDLARLVELRRTP